MSARRRHRQDARRLETGLLAAWRAQTPNENWRSLGRPGLAAAAAAEVAWGARRRRGQTLLRVFNPPLTEDAWLGAHSLVELIADDMPFLVDTLTMTLAARQLSVRLLMHPIVYATRDAGGRLLTLEQHAGERRAARAESWQRLWIDRVAGEAECKALAAALRAAINDVRAACRDWEPMRAAVRRLCEDTLASPPPVPRGLLAESVALLRYVEDHHFTLLGYSEQRLVRKGRQLALRAVPGSALGLMRRVEAAPHRGPGPRSADIRRLLARKELLLITQSNRRSTVHRPGFLDYIGVRRYDARGKVVGEARILGLWTSSAYHADPRQVPLLRYKYQRVVAQFPFKPDSHDGKRLTHILVTLPREELLQSSVSELTRCARAVLTLQEHRKLRLVLRRDEFGRFWSCLVFLPRERSDEATRQRIVEHLRAAFHASQEDSTLTLADSPLAQLYVVLRTTPATPARMSASQLEAGLAALTVSWGDELRALLRASYDELPAALLAQRYLPLFNGAYQQEVSPQMAAADIAALGSLGAEEAAMQLRLYRPAGSHAALVRLRLVRRGKPLAISEAVPILENFGLRVLAEHPYVLAGHTAGAMWIQDFELEQAQLKGIDLAAVEAELLAAFAAVCAGAQENDGFNRLIVNAGLGSAAVQVLRAGCRHLLQSGLPFSQATMERVLGLAHPAVARDLWQLFVARLHPVLANTARARRLELRLRHAIAAIPNPDEDRILRSLLAVFMAALRTNAFADTGRRLPAALAIKLDARRINHLPEPRPAFEIFVHGLDVEGVHLRMGAVARGGIRWSERPEDFRTEVLGLMKAQHVKNTVIVPAGAKGGFVVRKLDAFTDRDARAREVVACYRLFIGALLDLTDNIVKGKVVPPAAVHRRDGDDPYLVVAADKGTASFSDVANALAIERQFWLGDAFASGGSAGFDHKKMGITARGGWECVKRHFRELGLDIQRQRFTAAGIGDMSGDVFGNGMLLSRHMQLIAAFDHRHIFIDPDPDPARSFAERQRLFRLPRSSWADYDRRCISSGGGVFERSAKLITLSEAARTRLGLAEARVAPADAIRAILCMPVDLLWNGGIGTYVKAGSERHGEIGDRANDAVRVNGSELRARVVGEGGNLGFSQRGRIEYALKGGRLNTDFIDNSAGVNTSDVEVNLKILIDGSPRHLGASARQALLASLEPEVAELVLRNNYLQSQAISLLEQRAAAELGQQQQLLRWLERHGELNRELEFLPSDTEIDARRSRGQGLTRPELALLIAYGKIALTHALTTADLGADPALALELQRYFPAPLRRRYARDIPRHRLRRELIATAIANSLVNRLGPDFMPRMIERSSASAAEVARAYVIVRDSTRLRDLWQAVEALDSKVPAAEQYRALLATSDFLAALALRLLAGERALLATVGPAVAGLTPAWRALAAALPAALAGLELDNYVATRERWFKAGFPAQLAGELARLPALRRAPELAEIMRRTRAGAPTVAHAWFHLGAAIGLDWLHAALEALPGQDNWSALARDRLGMRALDAHAKLVEHALQAAARGAGREPATLQRWRQLQNELGSVAHPDLAALTVAVQALEDLARDGLAGALVQR
ncbi:MAG TPA: NAD-glutamate dehydrogenase [Steroidobacteraceae bacterium]|nr:NAD-glutamate dehydrogenase [Steroidobacteraceae bacterium]